MLLFVTPRHVCQRFLAPWLPTAAVEVCRSRPLDDTLNLGVRSRNVYFFYGWLFNSVALMNLYFLLLHTANQESSGGALVMLSAKACVPAQRDGVTFLTFTGVADLLEPDFDASKVQIDLLIPIGQMLLQQLSKGEFAIFKLSSMEVSVQKTVFVADAVYRPKETLQNQAVDEFRVETEAARTVLGNRRPVKRKQKQIDAQDLPEILELFSPQGKKARMAEALGSPSQA